MSLPSLPVAPLIAAALTVLALGASTSVQADPCDQSLAQCNFSQGQTEPVPLEARSIVTAAPPRSDDGGRALALYRSLIPAPYSMPDRPLVGIYLVHLNAPANVPGAPANQYNDWMEGGIDLRVRNGTELGWYHLVMPVNSDFEFQIGRAAGFPKYHADMTIGQDGASWQAQAAVGGKPSMQLRWTPASVSPDPAIVPYTEQRDPFFSLFPALIGPDEDRVKFTTKPYAPASDLTGGGPTPTGVPGATALPQPSPGLVHFTLDPHLDGLDVTHTLPPLFGQRDATLADLIQTDQILPGVMWNPRELLIIQTDRIGSGGGYSLASRMRPGSSSATASGRQLCVSRRVFTIHLPVRVHGRRVVAARVSINGRAARVRAGRRRAARVDLRGLNGGAAQVLIRLRTARAGTIVRRRTYLLCLAGRHHRRRRAH